MADVDAAYLIAVRINGVAIDGTPTEAEGTDEEVIEKADVSGDNKQPAQPKEPGGEATKEEDPPPPFRGSTFASLFLRATMSSP